jgi:hypothetical protein
VGRARSSSRLKLTRTGIVAGELSERVGGAENIHTQYNAVTQPNPISRSEIENKRRELLAETLNMHAAGVVIIGLDYTQPLE